MKDFVKTYATVMYIVGLVIGIIFCVTIVGALVGIPLIIGSNKFKIAKDASMSELVEMRSSLLGWGIFYSIVVAGSIFGFICILVCSIMVNKYLSGVEEGSMQETISLSQFANRSEETTATQEDSAQSIKDKLKEIDSLYEEGVITKEEYEAKRKKILDID